MEQKETLRKNIARLTAELDGELEYIRDACIAAGVQPRLLIDYTQGDHALIGFVLAGNRQIYYFEETEEYDEETGEADTTENFTIYKVDHNQLIKDKKIHTRALVAIEMAEAEN